jgi:DNA-binding transcriptional regulator YdaS (Cro superfamily)
MDRGLALIRKQRGLARKVAKALHIHPATVSRWHRIPAEYVIKIEKISGISRHALRPDIYPEENVTSR